jgi:hypothetical protein
LRKYAESEAYLELLKFLSSLGEKGWPLIIKDLAEGTIFSVNLLEDLTFTRYRYIMDEIRERNKARAFVDGKYNILPSLYSNVVEYSKQLLIILQGGSPFRKLKEYTVIDNGVRVRYMDGVLSIVNLEGYTGTVYTSEGQVVTTFVVTSTNDQHSISLPKGIYIVELTGSKKFVQKIFVE